MLEVGQYRKKPVVITAVQLDASDYDRACEIVSWCGGRAVDEGIEINTTEGPMLARDGWWIIEGVEHEFYPCASSVFEASYDAVGKTYVGDRQWPEPSIGYEEGRRVPTEIGEIESTDVDLTVWTGHVRVFVNTNLVYEGLTE